MAWTQMQQKAIYTRGSNIIVSAGAGSGKTAVLSERILDYCLKGNDIRKLLVLTFTNAASQEMKERIRKKLLDNGLLEQASLIDSAAITTFDAYSLSIVKKYFYLLGVDKNISIMDSALLNIKKKEILDEIFLDLYQAKDESFFSILRKYTKQNDDNIKKIILSLVDKLALIVDEKDFYATYEEKYYSASFIDWLGKEYEKLMLEFKTKLIKELEYLKNLCSTDVVSIKLFDEVEIIVNKLKELNSFDEIALIKDTISLPRINPKAMDEVKSQKTVCADLIKEFQKTFFSKYLLLEDAKREIYSIKDDVLYFLKIAVDVNERLYEYKKSIMCFDYNDIAKLSIFLIKNNQMVHDEIANNLNEILVDEYQDTSDIQEAFINLIANNNCYMVGDIKQSIYRFRNANPYIFKNKYDKYSLENGGVKIDLTHNFRSRKEVLNNINSLFSSLMTNTVGDANYAIDHIMHYGQKQYDELVQTLNFDFDILTYNSQEGYSDEEVEAFICGQEIKKLMNQKIKCLKGKEYVDITYSDIAILIDKTKSFITFKKVFEYLGIPLSVEADLDLNDSIIPKLFSNILLLITKTINEDFDKKYYHALASVGRSFLCSYSDEIIYKLCNENLKNDLNLIINKLSLDATNISVVELFYKIINEFQFYSKLELIGDVENSLVVIDYVHNLFQTMHNANMSIIECSDYLIRIFDSGIDLKYKLSKPEETSVRIMTIHKSKGLEFPYCFFPMLDSRFNKSEMKEAFGLSSKYGIFIPFSDDTNSNTIIKDLEAAEVKKADISEKVRLLYVALTRAREKMILISNSKEYSPNNLEASNYNCFNHMLRSKEFLREYEVAIDENKLNLTKKYLLTKKKGDLISGRGIEYINRNYRSEEIVKSKISKELNELVDSNLQRAINQGLLFHECLEVLDFNNINLEDLPVNGDIKRKLALILNNEVFKNIRYAKTYHEHEFYYNDYHGIIDLLCVYDDHIDIIDYKLANINKEEYIRQLSIYKEYVSSLYNLKTNCYLLSILNNEVKQIL